MDEKLSDAAMSGVLAVRAAGEPTRVLVIPLDRYDQLIAIEQWAKDAWSRLRIEGRTYTVASPPPGVAQ